MSHTLTPTQPRACHPSSLPPAAASVQGPRRSRTKSAKVMLVAIFVLLRLSDAFCFQAAYSALHPSPAMRGLTMIAGVWTTIFLVAVWMQKRWARYFLVISLGAVALVASTI